MPDDSTVVVVEDDPNICALVEMYLCRDGFTVVRAASGEEGLAAVAAHQPRAVVLDVGLGGRIDGFEVCRRLGAGNVAILMLTARDEEADRVLGLELGADDYVTKPFSGRELAARVKAILRRVDGRRDACPPDAQVPTVLSAGTVEVDVGRHEARVQGQAVALTAQEFSLLRFLAENAGLALTRQQLLDGAWGTGWYGDERTVDVHVRQLRKKLGDALPVTTVWGVGYRLG